MTVIPAPINRVVVLVVVGLVMIAAAALVVARLAPQDALLSSALMVVVAKGHVVERTRKEMGLVAAAVVVLGSAWGFGAWCSLEAFALWPGLLFTGLTVLAVGAAVARVGHETLQAFALRATPLSAGMAVAMVLSWFFLKRGPVGVAVAGVFVAWSVVSLVVTLGTLEEGDEPVGSAAVILDDLGFILWNSLVLWARLQPGDDADALLCWQS